MTSPQTSSITFGHYEVERAREALEKHETPEQRIAKSKRRRRTRDEEDISPAELLSRIRKVFKH